MPTVPREVAKAALAPFFATVFTPVTPYRVQRLALEAMARLQTTPDGTQVFHVKRGGRPAERVTVGATERPRAIVYLHGGGFTVGSPRVYRGLAAHLAQATGAVVFSVDYRLAPEHPYPAALDDAVAAVLEVCKDYPAHRVAIAGDSAGGGLAVATARCLVDYHGVRVGALCLMSPSVDPDRKLPKRDLVLNAPWGARNARAYRGGAESLSQGYAPGHGDLTGLPPMVIHSAVDEALQPLIKEFAQKVRLVGGVAALTEYPGLWHSAHGMAGVVREAHHAVQDMGSALRGFLD